MSIHDEIKHRIAEGRLFEVLPVMDEPIKRRMYVSSEINELLNGPWNDGPEWEERCGELRVTLEQFVIGAYIKVCLIPFKAQSAYMGRLAPITDEVWDIRSIDPSPALRVFGRFASKDVFVCFNWRSRSVDIQASNEPPLEEGSSDQWKKAINECKAEWRKLFPIYQPIHGVQVNDYIREKYIPSGDS